MSSIDERELYKAIVVDAPDALVFANREGVIRIWNGGAERIFGYPAADAIGQSLDMIIPERFRAAHWAAYRKALASGQTKYEGRVLTTRSIDRNGNKLYVDLSFGLVKDASGAIIGVVAIGRDCTERENAKRSASS